MDIFFPIIFSQIYWAIWKLAVTTRTILRSELSGLFQSTINFHHKYSGISKKCNMLCKRCFCLHTLKFLSKVFPKTLGHSLPVLVLLLLPMHLLLLLLKNLLPVQMDGSMLIILAVSSLTTPSLTTTLTGWMPWMPAI